MHLAYKMAPKYLFLANSGSILEQKQQYSTSNNYSCIQWDYSKPQLVPRILRAFWIYNFPYCGILHLISRAPMSSVISKKKKLNLSHIGRWMDHLLAPASRRYRWYWCHIRGEKATVMRRNGRERWWPSYGSQQFSIKTTHCFDPVLSSHYLPLQTIIQLSFTCKFQATFKMFKPTQSLILLLLPVLATAAPTASPVDGLKERASTEGIYLVNC